MPERKCKVLLILKFIFSDIDVDFVSPGKLKKLLDLVFKKKKIPSLGSLSPLRTNVIFKVSITYQQTSTNLIRFGLFYVFKFLLKVCKYHRQKKLLFFFSISTYRIPQFTNFMSQALKRQARKSPPGSPGFLGHSPRYSM